MSKDVKPQDSLRTSHPDEIIEYTCSNCDRAMVSTRRWVDKSGGRCSICFAARRKAMRLKTTRGQGGEA